MLRFLVGDDLAADRVIDVRVSNFTDDRPEHTTEEAQEGHFDRCDLALPGTIGAKEHDGTQNGCIPPEPACRGPT